MTASGCGLGLAKKAEDGVRRFPGDVVMLLSMPDLLSVESDRRSRGLRRRPRPGNRPASAFHSTSPAARKSPDQPLIALKTSAYVESSNPGFAHKDHLCYVLLCSISFSRFSADRFSADAARSVISGGKGFYLAIYIVYASIFDDRFRTNLFDSIYHPLEWSAAVSADFNPVGERRKLVNEYPYF